MKGRKITSLILLISLISLTINSFVLYITPHGRIAYWANWQLLGLTKTQWGNIHINTGILFIIALIFHIYYNWKPMISYLKKKNKLRIFTINFNISLIIVFIVTFGTLYEIPPFSSILDFSEHIKDKSIIVYGEPPYGHAELSTLKKFSKKMGWDLEQSIQLLKAEKIKFNDENETLQEIAKRNSISPKKYIQ